MRDKIRLQKGLGKKSEATFYVHEMLASFRTDEIPVYCKQRQVTQVLHDFYKPKPVFSAFIKDTPEIMGQCMSHDQKLINVTKIVDGREEEEKVVVKQLAINYQLIKDVFTTL